jgi:hypothetical protein
MLINPARQLYLNMDIDKIEEQQQAPSTGLLAPKRMMKNVAEDKVEQPAFRVAKHMKLLRQQREMLKNGN